MVPYNVVHLGPGRWHRATWGDLAAEDTSNDARAVGRGSATGRAACG